MNPQLRNVKGSGFGREVLCTACGMEIDDFFDDDDYDRRPRPNLGLRNPLEWTCFYRVVEFMSPENRPC